MQGLPWSNWSPEAEIRECVGFIREWHEKHEDRYKGCVVGLSGGVDSSVGAALLVEALGPEKVLGLCLPAPQSYKADLTSGLDLAARLGIESSIFVLDELLRALQVDPIKGISGNLRVDYETEIAPLYVGQHPRASLPDVFFKYLAIPSATLRARFLVLARYAEERRFSRYQTLNRSEILTFMWTPDADTGGDIAPQCHLFKTQIYRMAECLDLPPSCVLRLGGCGNHVDLVSDEQQMGLPWATLDALLYHMTVKGATDEELVIISDRKIEDIKRLRGIVRVAQEFYRHPAMRMTRDELLGLPA